MLPALYIYGKGAAPLPNVHSREHPSGRRGTFLVKSLSGRPHSPASIPCRGPKTLAGGVYPVLFVFVWLRKNPGRKQRPEAGSARSGMREAALEDKTFSRREGGLPYDTLCASLPEPHPCRSSFKARGPWHSRGAIPDGLDVRISELNLSRGKWYGTWKCLGEKRRGRDEESNAGGLCVRRDLRTSGC
jgi:hypothetical protein